MAEQKGVAGVIRLAQTGTSLTSSHNVLHVTSYSLEEVVETIDVTSMTDTSREILTSFKSFSGSVECYWDASDVAFGHDADTDPNVQAGTKIDFELYPAGETTGATNEIYYAGTAIVTSVTRSASFDGAVEFSLAFEGTGDLSYKAEDDA